MQDAVLEHQNAVAHGHRFDLVVRHVNEGGAQPLVQFGNLGAGRNAQLGVEIGERLVHEEDGRFAHDGPADGDALTLTTGKRFRLAVQELGQAQNFGRFLYAPVNLLFRRLAQFQTKGHVVVHAHVRIEGVRLEDHGDVPILGRNVVDDAITDQDLSFGNLLQPGQQA